jgi:hypothetical protein
VLGAASAARLQAQQLQGGTWTGTVIDPGGETINVSFDVHQAGDTTTISMMIPDGPTITMSGIHFDQSKLVFTWEAGAKIVCTLDPAAEGSYSGACVDDSGQSGTMTMVPPKKTG